MTKSRADGRFLFSWVNISERNAELIHRMNVQHCEKLRNQVLKWPHRCTPPTLESPPHPDTAANASSPVRLGVSP